MDTINLDDALHGGKVIGSILGVVNNVAWLIVGFGCTSFWMGVLVYILGTLITGLLIVAGIGVMAVAAPGALEAAGRGARVVTDKVAGLFGNLRARFA